MSCPPSESGSIYGLTQLGLRSSVKPAAHCQPTSAVTGPIFSNIRYPHQTFPGGIHDFYGSFYPGVVRPYGGFLNFGYLDPFGSPAPYQLFGAQGGSFFPTPLGFSAPGPPGFYRYRQYYRCLLYQPNKGGPIP